MYSCRYVECTSKLKKYSCDLGGNIMELGLLGFRSRKNKYDEEETEFWVDFRTSGVMGLLEKEGLKDSTTGTGTTPNFENFKSAPLNEQWNHRQAGTCAVETGRDKVPVL